MSQDENKKTNKDELEEVDWFNVVVRFLNTSALKYGDIYLEITTCFKTIQLVEKYY